MMQRSPLHYAQFDPSLRALGRETRKVIGYAREARKALSAVVKLSERQSRETLTISDEGLPIESWMRLSHSERVESLRQALVWLQQAENKVRDTRVALERAVERAERQANL